MQPSHCARVRQDTMTIHATRCTTDIRKPAMRAGLGNHPAMPTGAKKVRGRAPAAARRLRLPSHVALVHP